MSKEVKSNINSGENKDYFFKERKDETVGMVSNYQRGFNVEKLEEMGNTFKHKHLVSKWYTLENAKKWSDWGRKYCGLSDEKYDKWSKNTGIFAALFYGNCVSEDRLETLAKLLIFLFNNDDHTEYDEKVGLKYWNDTLDLLDKCEGKPDVSMIEWTQYTTAIYIIFEKIFQKYSANQVKRFVYFYKHFVSGFFDEFKLRKICDGYRSVEDCVNVRMHLVGMFFIAKLIEYSQDIELTDEEWSEDNFHKMIVSFVKHSVYVHELGSLKKELNVDDYDYDKTFNGVVAVKNVRNVSLDEAIDIVLQIIRDLGNEIEGYQKAVLESPNCSNDVKIFIECLNTLIAGHIYVSTYCDRFMNAFEPKERIYADDERFIQI